MSKPLLIKKLIKPFNKSINVTGDKSLSIRWVLLASQTTGKSRAYNLLMSDDVLAAINAIKILGIKVKMKNDYCEIHGNGINRRHYLFVKDFCSALEIIIKKVNDGIYNIGSDESYQNIQIAKKICSLMKKSNNNIKYTKDRPFNDKRYSVSSKKIQNLGWKPKTNLFKELNEIIKWYTKNNKIFS